MAVLALLVLGLLAGSACSAPSPARIIGGSPTTIEQYPSIVQVDFLSVWTGVWSQSCGASVLTVNYILSAAHCFEGVLYNINNRRIRAGTTFRGAGGSLHYAEAQFNHPSYGRWGMDGDISVVRLRVPLIYSPSVQQGRIIAQDNPLPDNLPVVYAGWGETAEGVLSNVLVETTVYTVNRQLCAARYDSLPYPGFVSQNMFCAGLLDVGGRDACVSDSGGPVYYEDIVVGIISWGHGCDNATYPGVNTAVSSYTDWIVRTAV